MLNMQWKTLSQFDLSKKKKTFISIFINFLGKMLKWDNRDSETGLRSPIKTGWPRKRQKC